MVDDDDLMQALEEANPADTNPTSNEPPLWHVTASGTKGQFQWLVNNDGDIVDCPYHLRGYWLGRKVDLDLLLAKTNPKIIVTCDLSGHIDEIRATTLDVVEAPSGMSQLPDYVYDQPYTGGLYDIRQFNDS